MLKGIEGAGSENTDVLTVNNATVFRENFHKLFSQKLPSSDFNLIIEPFGSVTKTKKVLEYIERQGIDAVFLIDLDGPKEKREERLGQYNPFYTSKIFFMIQEMEAWILSQVDKIEQFGKNEGLMRKKEDQNIENSPLIKNKHPEEIRSPSKKLDTILRQYFDVTKIRHSKSKDGPKLIGLLELQILVDCFDEAKRLVDYIYKRKIKLLI